jgi:hypothetical protein
MSDDDKESSSGSESTGDNSSEASPRSSGNSPVLDFSAPRARPRPRQEPHWRAKEFLERKYADDDEGLLSMVQEAIKQLKLIEHEIRNEDHSVQGQLHAAGHKIKARVRAHPKFNKCVDGHLESLTECPHTVAFDHHQHAWRETHRENARLARENAAIAAQLKF